MKKLILIIISALICGVAFVSCNSDTTDEKNSVCVKIIKSSPGTTVLSKSEMGIVKNLFNRNQLDYTKCLFTQFQQDELGYYHIRCYQFANNLIVFTSDAIFHFDQNGNYYFLSGKLINNIDLDTKPSMDKNKVAQLFKSMLVQDGNTALVDNCFDIEFGYYDLNAFSSTANGNFTKAWKIYPANREYPYAYINDENSEIITYDNGIILN